MNGSQFDALTKHLATPTSRRTTLKALAGVAIGGLTGLFASRTSPVLAGNPPPSGPCSSPGQPCCNISSANVSFCSASGLTCQGRTCASCGGTGQPCCSDTAAYLYEGNVGGSCAGDGNASGAARGTVNVSKLGNSLVVNITLQRARSNTTYQVNINCVNGACNQGTINTDGFGNGRGQIIFPGQGNQPGFFSISLQTFTGCGAPPPGSDSINSGPLSLGGCTNGGTCTSSFGQSGVCGCATGFTTCGAGPNLTCCNNTNQVCSGGACVPCGNVYPSSQPCCANNGNSCIPGGSCSSTNICVQACGGGTGSDPCCLASPSCQGFRTCLNNVCAVCGGIGQPCCNNGTTADCYAGTCLSGTCNTPV